MRCASQQHTDPAYHCMDCLPASGPDLQRWFLHQSRQSQADDVRCCRKFNKPSDCVVAQLNTTRVGRLLGGWSYDVMITSIVERKQTSSQPLGKTTDKQQPRPPEHPSMSDLRSVVERVTKRSLSPPAESLTPRSSVVPV